MCCSSFSVFSPQQSALFWSIAFLLLSTPVFAQFSDTFTDGNFSKDPVWSGNTAFFVIDNSEKRLRLNAPSSSRYAYLSTPSRAIDNASWTFTLILNFNPSGNNFARIYLVSNQADINAALNGYFVAVGGANDEISLYRQQATSVTKIIDGLDRRVDQSPVMVKIRVTRDEAGTWTLFTDTGNTGTFDKEGSQFDNTFSRTAYFGIACYYTSSRSDKFSFDDFVVIGDPYTDKSPPIMLSIDVLSDKTIAIIFSEPLDQKGLNDLTRYAIDQETYHPINVRLSSGADTVTLTFQTPFENGKKHLLTITDVTDLSGNTATQLTRYFRYVKAIPAVYKDVIISEIFASPTLVTNAEFVELYNRSANPFLLTGWTLSDGSKTASLPEQLLLSGEYQIITSPAGASTFNPALSPIGVSAFPILNNDNDMLVLKDSQGQTVDSVYYTAEWYRNTEKAQGGWSLELIDPDDVCRGRENWQASESEQGSTPGVANSVLASKPDLLGPKLVSVIALNPLQLLLTFDESLESPLRNTRSFSLTPALAITKYTFKDGSSLSLVLHLDHALQPKQIYTLTLENIYDCSGNLIQPDFSQSNFALPEQAVPNDLLINEILFNPRPGGVDFVEVYNASDKYINLNNWHIIGSSNSSAEKILTYNNVIMNPGAYRVFTSDPPLLNDRYPQGMESLFMKVDLPPLPDNEGFVVISRPDGVTIDSLFYSQSFHSPFLREDEGVSLERISLTEKTNAPGNWRSASSTAGFATPGFVNSNFRSAQPFPNEPVTVDPTIFVPDSGGPDFVSINFHFGQSGLVATVKIFDHQGRLIKTLANNELLGTDGFFRWEGERDNGARARVGYYYVSFLVFGNSGAVGRFRKRIIVAPPR